MTKPVKMKARDVLALSKDELWALPHSNHLVLTFDDGEVTTTTKRTIYCAYLWNIHRAYPKTPLLTRHHMGMERISSKVHNTLLETVYRDWYDTYCQDPAYDREACWKLLYETVNEVYNDFTQRIDDHVATLSILDFVEVLDNPVIREANDAVVPTQKSINDTYDTITKALIEDQSLNHNAIAQAVRSSLVDIKQVLQCVGPRGFLTEINSTIWPQPITVGYAQGMRSLYDSMIESRSAAKALMFAKRPAGAVRVLQPQAAAGWAGGGDHRPGRLWLAALHVLEGGALGVESDGRDALRRERRGEDHQSQRPQPGRADPATAHALWLHRPGSAIGV